jgi:hypothetical protein
MRRKQGIFPGVSPRLPFHGLKSNNNMKTNSIQLLIIILSIPFLLRSQEYFIKKDTQGSGIGLHEVPGGFLIFGDSYFIGANSRFFLLKVSTSGEYEWIRDYGIDGNLNEQQFKSNTFIKRQNGNGVGFCGVTFSEPDTKYKGLLCLTDFNGVVENSSIIEIDRLNTINAFHEISTSDYLIGGLLSHGFLARNDGFICRYSLQHDSIHWIKKIENTENFSNVSFIKEKGDTIYLGGAIENEGAYFSYIKTMNVFGEEYWTHYYGIEDQEIFQSCEFVEDGIIITGKTRKHGQSNKNILVRKINFDGTPIWSNGYGIEDRFSEGKGISKTNDGGAIVTGFASPPVNLVLLKLNNEGDQEWIREFDIESGHPNSAGNSRGNDVIVIDDKIITIGYFADELDTKLLIIQTNEFGLTVNSREFIDEKTGGVNLFPNPFKTNINIEFKNRLDFDKLSLIIHTIDGKILMKRNGLDYKMNLDLPITTKGQYLVTILAEETGKLYYSGLIMKE